MKNNTNISISSHLVNWVLISYTQCCNNKQLNSANSSLDFHFQGQNLTKSLSAKPKPWVSQIITNVYKVNIPLKGHKNYFKQWRNGTATQTTTPVESRLATWIRANQTQNKKRKTKRKHRTAKCISDVVFYSKISRRNKYWPTLWML